MKTAGYWECRNEIIAARLPTPHKYEPFTELFDVDKLDAIRDKYGVDLYRECYTDVAREVMADAINAQKEAREKMTYSEKIAEVKKVAVNCQITGGLLDRGYWYGENPYADHLIECALLWDLFPETVADFENFCSFRRSDYAILRLSKKAKREIGGTTHAEH
jgi:hypothetical protein